MSGTLTLSTENVLSWFGTLGERLRKPYDARTMYTRNGGQHLATIYLRQTAQTNYHVALYQVQPSVHYVVALCEMDGPDRVCHRAWSLVGEQQPSVNSPKIFCSSCVYVHEVGNGDCPPQETVELLWNASNKSDGETVDSLISQLTEGITCALGRPTPAL